MDPGQGAILSDVDQNLSFAGDTDPRSCVCLVPALLGGQGIKLAAGDPVVRLHGSLCLSQGLCYIPASDPAPARGSSSPWLEQSARRPRASGWLSSDPLKLPFAVGSPIEPAASRHAVNATRVHPFSSVSSRQAPILWAGPHASAQTEAQ